MGAIMRADARLPQRGEVNAESHALEVVRCGCTRRGGGRTYSFVKATTLVKSPAAISSKPLEDRVLRGATSPSAGKRQMHERGGQKQHTPRAGWCNDSPDSPDEQLAPTIRGAAVTYRSSNNPRLEMSTMFDPEEQARHVNWVLAIVL